MILLALILIGLPHAESREVHHVDVIEINTFTRTSEFRQVIFWEYRTSGYTECRGWLPLHRVDISPDSVSYYRSQQLVIVRGQIEYTETDYDPEMRARRTQPVRFRRLLPSAK